MENGLENKLLKTYINSGSFFLTLNISLFFCVAIVIVWGPYGRLTLLLSMFPLEIKSIWLTSFHKDSWRHLVQIFWKWLTICKISFSLKFNCVYWYTSISLIVFYICTCLNCLEDEFHFFTWMSVVPWIKKKAYIKPYHWKRLKMPKFIELIKKQKIKLK